MKSMEFDMAIIGGGCIGSSIAAELSRRGFRNAVLIDQGRSTQSATASSGGILRVFHENLDHMELALNNLTHLKTYQEEEILKEKNQFNGSLYFFASHRLKSYEKNFHYLESKNYPFEILNSDTGSERFPDFLWSKNQLAVYEPLGSHLSPLQFATDLLNFSQNSGLTLVDDFSVERFCFFRDRYKIFSSDAVITAKTLILAGGARLLPQMKDLGISDTLSIESLKIYRSSKPNTDFQLPNYFDRENLEFARLGHGSEIILSHLKSQRLLNVSWNESSFTEITANDCYSPNRQGAAGFLMGHPRLLLATGWGGTAFKFALEIGHRIGNLFYV